MGSILTIVGQIHLSNCYACISQYVPTVPTWLGATLNLDNPWTQRLAGGMGPWSGCMPAPAPKAAEKGAGNRAHTKSKARD